MNLDVAILSGISFNRLHFMVMWPVPCHAMCTYPLHMHGLTCTNPQSQTNTHLPALIKTLCVPIAPSLSIMLLHLCTVWLLLPTCVSSLMRFRSFLSDVSICLDVKESDGLTLTTP